MSDVRNLIDKVRREGKVAERLHAELCDLYYLKSLHGKERDEAMHRQFGNDAHRRIVVHGINGAIDAATHDAKLVLRRLRRAL